jgi:predicted dehydrogenase
VWGIAGTGSIATRFAHALRRVPDAHLGAVGSRTPARAQEFASALDVPVAHGSFEELVADGAVDVLYLASPHSEHHRQAVLALTAGKHVLVEKPMALSARQVQEMVAAARAGGGFLMEAMWTRFLPAYVRLRELLGEGLLGPLSRVESALGFAAPYDPTHRIYRPDLGGGVLLDMGVYPLQLAQLVLGEPTGVRATATLGPSGVDHDTVVDLTYAAASARLHSSLLTDLEDRSRVEADRGALELLGPVYAPEALAWDGHVTELPIGGDGLRYEALEVHRCLAAGLQQSPVMSWADSLLLAQTVDEVRGQIGLTYP